jgi:hypothetical protein
LFNNGAQGRLKGLNENVSFSIFPYKKRLDKDGLLIAPEFEGIVNQLFLGSASHSGTS